MTLNLDKAGRVLSVDIASAAVEGIRRTAIVQTHELLRRSLEVLRRPTIRPGAAGFWKFRGGSIAGGLGSAQTRPRSAIRKCHGRSALLPGDRAARGPARGRTQNPIPGCAIDQNYRLEMDRLQAHLSDQERMLAGQIVRNVMRLVSQSQQFMEAFGVTLESSNRIARASLDMVNRTSLEVTKEDEDIAAASCQAGGGRQVKPATIHYRMARTSGRMIVTCTLGGPCDSGTRVINPGPSQQICNHSPTGFEFGYPGSGPAGVALAILFDFTESHDLALRLYQAFRFDFVAPLDKWRGAGSTGRRSPTRIEKMQNATSRAQAGKAGRGLKPRSDPRSPRTSRGCSWRRHRW